MKKVDEMRLKSNAKTQKEIVELGQKIENEAKIVASPNLPKTARSNAP